jgi:2-polyprenyl-3-methyl-5-hydroxy-6-metoxy-1,4-benzoquinol methylase
MTEDGRGRGFDTSRAEAFAARMRGVLNDGALCLMISVGHRVGLFDALRDFPPATPAAIATRAGLNERYVREWLGAMTAARVIEIDAATGGFVLPPEHAASLARAAGDGNRAPLAQYIPILGAVEEAIVDCFRAGGGVPYERFARFHEVMAEDSGQSVAAALETAVLPLVPGLQARLLAGARVLDVGCGRGLVMMGLATLFPASRVTGYDLSVEAIAHGREEARRRGITNLDLQVRDLSNFDVTADPAAFDLVTAFDAVHDQAQPLRLLRGVNRTLARDGIFLMQDIRAASAVEGNLEHPLGSFLYTVSCLHCMTVSLAQGGEGLGAMWGEETTRDYLERAGFGSVETHRLPHDIQNNWYVVRR